MALVTVGVLSAACSGPPPAGRPEVLGQVEFPFDRAVRKALDEVPGSKLFSIALRRAQGPEPVWRTEVATEDGTVHVVRVDATLGRLLGTAVPAGHPPAEKARTAALVEAAKVLPEEAAEKAAATAVTDPHFGKVTAVRMLRGREQKPVWSVSVAALRPEDKHIYRVDAVTAEVVGSRTSEPTPSPSPTASPAE